MAQAREVYGGVAVDPQIVHDKPVLAGTRVPVALVLCQMAGGLGSEELERGYGETRAHARIALAFAAQLVASESAYVVAGE